MSITAIDPGNTESAFVVLIPNGRLPIIEEFGKIPNEELLTRMIGMEVVIEKIASYGMAVGEEVFETVYWSGRFAERALLNGWSVHRIPRKNVKLQLCMDTRAKDANIRQALIDRWGGKHAIKKGGELHGIANDVWQALAVGLTWIETRNTRALEG